MPIKKTLRQFYGATWRREVRPRILARAGDCCEQCSKPNHAIIQTITLRRVMWWRLEPFVLQPSNPTAMPLPWTDQHGRTYPAVLMIDGTKRTITVVLTIAHLNHVAGDDRDDNLKALCQWCHLNYDKEHHRETRATRKDLARPLLQAGA